MAASSRREKAGGASTATWIARATSSLPVSLPRDHDRQVRRGDLLDEAEHRADSGRTADEVRERRARLGGRRELAVLALEPHAHARVLDRQGRLIGERFHEPEVVLGE
jgi:hypothetical protein